MWELSEAANTVRERERAQVNERLKASGGDPITEYELDLRLFRRMKFGDPVKHEFLIRCWNHQWPDFFLIESQGIRNIWHVRMARAFCKYKRVSMMGCASSGKTFVSGAHDYTRWKSDPTGTSVYLSTTSAEAGEARTWGTVKDLFNQDRYQIGKLINSLRVITLDEETRNESGEKERDYRNCIKAVLIKSGAEGKNVVGSICGRKNDAVLWTCDEEPFLDPGILDARVNLFSNDFAQFKGIGNAPEEGDPLYIDAEPFGPEFPDGWRSVDKDVHEFWPTKTGFCLYFNGARSPNMKVPRGKPSPFPKLMNWEKMDEILLTAGGEDTPVYFKQFYGFPPTVDIPDKIITYKLLESNGCYEQPLWAGIDQKCGAGLDLGFREGGDPCVADFFRIGKDTRGRTVASFEKDGVVLNPSQSSKDPFETQIALKFISECRKRDCHDVALDVTGDGGMILQAIEREARTQGYKLNVIPVSFSGTAEDRVVIPGEKRKGSEMFGNMVSQLWASFRISALNGVLRGCDAYSKAITQLCSRKFITDERRRFLVEKKSDMKQRLKRSPDQADARCLGHHLALKMGLSGAIVNEAAAKQEKRQEAAATAQQYSSHASASIYGGR